MKFLTGVKNIHMEGTLSQIFYLPLCSYLIGKNGQLLDIISNLIFYIK